LLDGGRYVVDGRFWRKMVFFDLKSGKNTSKTLQKSFIFCIFVVKLTEN
jgi:hypothetical protein